MENTKLELDKSFIDIIQKFGKLVEDYSNLNERFPDLSEPEFDLWIFQNYQIQTFYERIYNEIVKVEDTNFFRRTDFYAKQRLFFALIHNKIFDQRQLKIENDPELARLYDEVRQMKKLLKRE